MLAKRQRSESLTTTGIDIESCVKVNDQRSIARFVSKTTPKKVVESRAIRTAFEDRLDTLRSQWVFWNDQNQLSILDESGLSPVMIQGALSKITNEANEINQQLSTFQSYKSLGEKLREGEDIEQLELLVVDMILLLRESLSITNNITPNQAKEVAMIVCEQFAGLSFEEIAICFHKGKSGEYGEIMHRLDANVIMSWLNKFTKEISAISVELHSQDHKQLKWIEKEGKTSVLDYSQWFKVLPRAHDPQKDLYKQKSLDNAAKQFFDGF